MIVTYVMVEVLIGFIEIAIAPETNLMNVVFVTVKVNQKAGLLAGILQMVQQAIRLSMKPNLKKE